jgi:hypothetical protein
MAHTKPFSIRIFMPEGQADGLKIVEKSNWSGRGVVCPRALLSDHKTRDEFSRTGIYILVGHGDSGGLPTLYIGQADPIRRRLDDHHAKKEFWNTAVFFVSKAENLNKAHVSHLESRLIRLAKEAKRCTLDNANEPTFPSMSEMDIADAEGFLEEMLLCLPVLGINHFTKPRIAPKQIRYSLKGDLCVAKGYESPEGFVVMAGSLARRKEVKSIHQYLSDLRSALLNEGIFVPQGEDQYRLSQDYTFSSPSSASAVMLGRTSNGRMEWLTDAGQTLKAIQERDAGETD